MDFFEKPQKKTNRKKSKFVTQELDEEEEVEDCNKEFEQPLDFTVIEIPRDI